MKKWPETLRVAFPLTPALSPGEREKRSQFFGKTMVVSGLNSLNNLRLTTAVPSPWGEGQGEGERRLANAVA
jgi:hypothetical protein